jgi:amidohydrolase
MAMLLGAATLLADLVSEGQSDVNVRLLFQPAEEATGLDGVTGALRTIHDGVLIGVDAALALHVEPSQELGVVRLGSGYVMAGVDTFIGVIRGVGGHAARPEDTVDPFWLLPPVLSAIHGIVGRRISPLESAVISLCHIVGGDITNVIPNDVMLEGTIRSFKPEVRERLCYELEAAFAIVRSLGGEVDLDIRAESPPLYNDEAVRAKLLTSIGSLEIGGQILDGQYGLMGEDFAEFAERVPSAMVMLGCAPEAGVCSLHSPEFGFNERVLERGAALLAHSSLTLGRF